MEIVVKIQGTEGLESAIMQLSQALIGNQGAKVSDQVISGQPATQVPAQQFTQPAAVPQQYSTPVQQVGQAPVQQVPPVQNTPPMNSPVQTSQVSYTMDDLAKAAMTLMDAGRQGELLNLLAQFGVEALPSLPQGQYGAFATALRGLGAQI